VLSYLKLTTDMSHVTLLVKKSDGNEAAVELKPEAIDRDAVKKFIRANASAKAREPISFKKNDDRYWYEFLAEKNMVYCQYNQVANKDGESLENFWGKMFEFINQKSVHYLVIDMRNNGGGNNFLNRPLIHGLIRCDRVNQPGHLFVLIGRTTFSAAMNCAVDIERNTHAIFVGEATGSSPNFVGETNILVLPCSGVRLSCSSLYWQSSTATDRRTWIAPTLKAEPSFVAFAANRDPGLEAINAYLDTDSVGADAVDRKDHELSLRDIVDECNRQAVKDFKKGNMQAVARGYADDATIYFPRGKKIHGREEIDRYWKSVQGAMDWKLKTLEVGGTKETIYEVGKSTLTTELHGKESTYVCDYVVIWKRQKDGAYRAHTDILN
jgi:ketosteroid isomerase-like protein